MTQPVPDATRLFGQAQLALPLRAYAFEDLCRSAPDPLPDDPARFMDLYLARACVEQVCGAAELLMRRHGASIRQALGRMKLTEDQRDEAQAALLRILFVGEGSGPAIAGYRGQGSLDGWVRVSATRAAHRVLRAKVAAIPPPVEVRDATAILGGVWREPETQVLLAEFREVFAEATERALASLAAADRRALRQHYCDRLSIDVLAQAWGVHRATAARRLGRVRRALRTQVLDTLGAHFGTSHSSAARLVQRAQSQLSGARRLLAHTPGGADLATQS